VGGEAHREVDVRLVCATHRDLRREVERGRFREDLFYRVHRFVLEVPPLRRRAEDVEALAAHFLADMEREVGRRVLTDGALGRLRAHPWPGNVRELRNVLEVAAASSGQPVVDAQAVDRAIRRIADPIASAPSPERLQETLAHYDGNVSAAARALGMPRSTLRDRLRSAPEP
jgi:DNA-binding NtrC family response regulator